MNAGANPTATITCPRCSGTGTYSFSLRFGRVCFRCRGAKTITVDAQKYAAQQARAAARKAKAAARDAERARIAKIVWNELQAELGPFPDTPVGVEQLVYACQRRYGKTPGRIVSERLDAGLPTRPGQRGRG